MFMHPSELGQSHLAKPPEVLDTVDMVVPIGKYVVVMLYPVMLLIAIVYQSVVGSVSVAINNSIGVGTALDNGH